jgi:CDP-glucose 4,6-dehydratase
VAVTARTLTTGPLAAAYKNKRVLITGHTGFKGGWLATWLKMMRSRVTGLSLPPEPAIPSFFESARVAEGMSSLTADIRDFDSVRSIFAEHKPEIVFHNAAQALVRRSYRDPIETYATNVMGTVHVLEAARQTASTRAVVIVTSDKCYENREWVWGYRENDPMGGFDPYSSSKGCAELVTAAYRRSFFLTTDKGKKGALVASARAGNVIGGGDWSEDRLVPDLVRGIMSGAKIVIRNPRALRPWQHVLDPLYGYLLLAQRLCSGEREFAESWNFGPHEASIPVSDLAQRCLQLWGTDRGKARLQLAASKSQLHEAHYLKLDCSKAQARLGWEARLGVDDMLQWTVDWYRNVIRDPRCAQQLTCRQITQYMELVSSSTPR